MFKSTLSWYCIRVLLTYTLHTGAEVIHAASILRERGTLRVFNVAPAFMEEITSRVCNLDLQSNVQRYSFIIVSIH